MFRKNKTQPNLNQTWAQYCDNELNPFLIEAKQVVLVYHYRGGLNLNVSHLIPPTKRLLAKKTDLLNAISDYTAKLNNGNLNENIKITVKEDINKCKFGVVDRIIKLTKMVGDIYYKTSVIARSREIRKENLTEAYEKYKSAYDLQQEYMLNGLLPKNYYPELAVGLDVVTTSYKNCLALETGKQKLVQNEPKQEAEIHQNVIKTDAHSIVQCAEQTFFKSTNYLARKRSLSHASYFDPKAIADRKEEMRLRN
jgi:hypothetical protein